MLSALVIDDNRDTADCLCQMLTVFGIRATPTYSPRAAFQILATKTPNIIFVDINMPGVTGFEVLSFVQRDPRLCKIPVVVITSDDQEVTAHRVREGGAVDLIIKPVTLEVLEKILKSTKMIK